MKCSQASNIPEAASQAEIEQHAKQPIALAG
jgi:hypothetical protein